MDPVGILEAQTSFFELCCLGCETVVVVVVVVIADVEAEAGAVELAFIYKLFVLMTGLSSLRLGTRLYISTRLYAISRRLYIWSVGGYRKFLRFPI